MNIYIIYFDYIHIYIYIYIYIYIIMNNILTLYFINEFVPKYCSSCKDIFYMINNQRTKITKWEDVLIFIDGNTINHKEFVLYTRYYINGDMNITKILKEYFEKEYNEYMFNCSDKITLYHKCKEYLINLNNIILFLQYNQSLYYDNIQLDILNVELKYIDNITEHIIYILSVGEYVIQFIQNYLYEYTLFNLHSDIPNHQMFLIPILNRYNIQSRNDVIKEPLSVDYLYDINNKRYDQDIYIYKYRNRYRIQLNNYKENCRKIYIILNQCIDYMYCNTDILPSVLDISYNIFESNFQIIDTEYDMINKSNMTQTPIKRAETQYLTIKNRLSTPRKNNIRSPYQVIIEMDIDKIHINKLPKDLLRKNLSLLFNNS